MAVEIATDIDGTSSIGSYGILFILFISLLTSYIVSASFVIWRTEGIWRLPFRCGMFKNFYQCFSSLNFTRRYYTTVGEVDNSIHDDNKPVSLRNKLGSKETLVVDSIIDVVPSSIQEISPQRRSFHAEKRQSTLPIFIQIEQEIDQDIEEGYQRRCDSDSSSSSHESNSSSPLHPFNIETGSPSSQQIRVPIPRNSNSNKNKNTHFLSNYKISDSGIWRLNQGLKAAQQLINPRSFWSSTTNTSLLARTWEEAPTLTEPRTYSTFVSTSVS